MPNQSTPSAPKRQEPKRSRHKRRKKRGRKSAGVGELRLTFGRFRGWRIQDVPESYLLWMARTKRIPLGDRWLVEQFLKAEEVTA